MHNHPLLTTALPHSSMTSFTTPSRYWLATSKPRCTSASGTVCVKSPSVEKRPCSISATASGKSRPGSGMTEAIRLTFLRKNLLNSCSRQQHRGRQRF